MLGWRRTVQCLLLLIILFCLKMMWAGTELFKAEDIAAEMASLPGTEYTIAKVHSRIGTSTIQSDQCSSEYWDPKRAKIFIGPPYGTRQNRKRYDAFRSEFEMYTRRDANHTFNLAKLPNAGFQFTDLHGTHDHKTLVLGCRDKALRGSPNWTSWYYSPPDPDNFSTCEITVPGTAVFFRGLSFGRFIYGALLHDILPPVLWLYDNEPKATPVFEIEKSGKVVDFMKWFDPALHSRALYVPAGKTVCAESLLVMVPHRDIVHPEILRSAQLFTHFRQHFFKIHSQNPVNSVVYLYRNPKINCRQPATCGSGRCRESAADGRGCFEASWPLGVTCAV